MIHVQHLVKRYGGTLAVDDLTFSVRPGLVTGFLGPNGAGKSATMRLIVGLDHPEAGAALVGGLPYGRLRHPLREVGALLDGAQAHPGHSARTHLRALAAVDRIPDARVDEVLGLVGLSEVSERRVRGFSLGMSQRLGIAAALLGNPQVLLLDEPVNGLDPDGVRWIRGLMRSLAAEGRTVLVSSHLMSEMQQTADHLVVIGRGRLLADAPLASLVEQTAAPTARVRSPQAEQLAARLEGPGRRVERWGERLTVTGVALEDIGACAHRAGVTLHELSSTTATLEETYLRLTSGEDEHVGRAGGGS